MINFCFIYNFSFVCNFYTFYVTKIPRLEGHKIVGNILNKQNPDKVIYTYYSKDRFLKYLDKEFPSYWIDKTKRFVYLDNPTLILNEIEIGDRISVVFWIV